MVLLGINALYVVNHTQVLEDSHEQSKNCGADIFGIDRQLNNLRIHTALAKKQSVECSIGLNLKAKNTIRER